MDEHQHDWRVSKNGATERCRCGERRPRGKYAWVATEVRRVPGGWMRSKGVSALKAAAP